MKGTANLKIALDTRDDAAARERWGHVHHQVENIVDRATSAFRQAKASQRSPAARDERWPKLSGDHAAVLGDQTRHDVLKSHDLEWADPNHFTPLARGLKCALRARAEGRLTDPTFVEALKAYPDNMSDNEIRSAARAMESRVIRAHLKDRDLGDLNRSYELEEYKLQEGAGYKLDRVERIPSELEQRLDDNNLSLGDSDIDLRLVGLAIQRAKLDGLKKIEAREAGEVISTPDRPGPIASPETKKPRRLIELHAKWKERKTHSEKAIDDNLLYVERFIDIVGDIPIAQITQDHVREYRDTLKKYPRSPPAPFAEGRVQDAIDWARANPGTKLLTKCTINAKGLGALSTLFETAYADGYVKSNPFHKMNLVEEAHDHTARLPFDDEDLHRLFASPLYTDAKFLPSAGGFEASFWMPLIALFSGMRLEEIGQLDVNDIRQSPVSPYFDITTLENKSPHGSDKPDPRKLNAHRVDNGKAVKTLGSIRRIPIHPLLIELGFLQFVARRRKEGGRRLFNHLNPYRERCTKNWSRWWGRYQNKEMTILPEKDFHSFRHTFKDALREAGVVEKLQDALLGHASGKVGDKYGLGQPISILAPEIEKIKYGVVDVVALKQVAAKAI
ncbi:MAG: site-specific integrase [Roseiarcus sp.]